MTPGGRVYSLVRKLNSSPRTTQWERPCRTLTPWLVATSSLASTPALLGSARSHALPPDGFELHGFVLPAPAGAALRAKAPPFGYLAPLGSRLTK